MGRRRGVGGSHRSKGTGWRRAAAAAAAVLLPGLVGPVGALPAIAPVATAAAQVAVTVEVEPATGLADGQVVDVTVRGADAPITLAQCDPELLPPDPVGQPTNIAYCRFVARGEPVDGVVRLPMDVLEHYVVTFRGTERPTTCGGLLHHDCLIVAVDDGVHVRGTAPIHFGPPRAEPGITVTPASDITPGQEVEVQIVGLGPEIPATYLCDAATVARLEDEPELVDQACLRVGDGDRLDPLVVRAPLPDTWAVDGDGLGLHHCGPAPGGCSVVARGSSSGEVLATEPVDFAPDPLAIAPTDQEVGHPIRAWLFLPDRAGQVVRVAQCAAPVRPTARANRCAPAQSVTLDGAGGATVELTTVGAIARPGGATRCDREPCAIVVFAANGATLASRPITVYPADPPPTLTVEPPGPLYDGQVVDVTVTGTRNSRFAVALCEASVVPERRIDPARCTTWLAGWFGRATPSITLSVPVSRQPTADTGDPLQCDGPGGCAFVAAEDGGAFLSTPLVLRPLPVATLAPAEDLLEGQSTTLRVTGVWPGRGTVTVERCDGPVAGEGHCETAGDLVADVGPDGTVEVVVPAKNRFWPSGAPGVYCRRQCHVGLVDVPGSLVPYAMAEGTLTAMPSAGLVDGQAVDVVGRELSPSYNGGSAPAMPEGVWALAQCGRGLQDERTVVGVYRHCSVPAGGGIVTVAAHDLEARVEVRSHPVSLLGDPLDCTAAPGACTLALVRHEVDGTLTIVPAPLTFA